MKTVIKDIIKQVGINGLIAIKSDRQRSGNTPIYWVCKQNGLDFTAQNLIFNHLIMVKPHAQYQ